MTSSRRSLLQSENSDGFWSSGEPVKCGSDSVFGSIYFEPTGIARAISLTGEFMLNLDDPQSEFIFEASAIEDRIRAELLLLQGVKGSAELIGREEQICLVLIPQLHRLNELHFGNSPKIRQTIQALEQAVGRLDHARAWDCFLALAEHPGDNFGTWMI